MNDQTLTPRAVEEIKLRKRLTNDGNFVRFIGWLALVLAPLFAHFINGNSWSGTLLLTFVIVLPVALWLEYSGSYIAHMKGKFVSKFLFINALLMLLLVRGLLPLFLSIELFIVWFKLRKFKRQEGGL